MNLEKDSQEGRPAIRLSSRLIGAVFGWAVGNMLVVALPLSSAIGMMLSGTPFDLALLSNEQWLAEWTWAPVVCAIGIGAFFGFPLRNAYRAVVLGAAGALYGVMFLSTAVFVALTLKNLTAPASAVPVAVGGLVIPVVAAGASGGAAIGIVWAWRGAAGPTRKP